MRIDILTLFPGMFEGVLGESILGIAREKEIVRIHLHDIRDWSTNKHNKVDDRPFGGGPGMVMCCQPVVDAVEAVRAMDASPGRLFFLTPEGQRFDQEAARALSREERLILVCGRYEGFDERIFEILRPERLSIGDMVLTGGELPAMVVVDAVTRLLPGALGCEASAEEESFGADDNLLDHPHYTQPAEFHDLAVPEVLRSGHHAKVAEWRKQQALARTKRFRPDLLAEGGAPGASN